ncbi:DUF2147 domain-containing protein [Flavobacterium sp. RSB2_4_14]|uniref:DUF2147 domain-containing protein n=1 Tax=Flavobacterium sp. RSB2_4_14 TaxID=3447665 RepID=UPI003F33EC44
MKLKTLYILLFFTSQIGFSQSILGKWKTIDDETGKEKSIVEIFEKQGKVYGKIIEIFESEHRHRKCEKCEGEDKNKPILGLIIIKGLKKSGAIYEGGKITDPKNGSSYNCKISMEGKDKLIVRGYIGISLFGRSQNWIRYK